MSNADIKAIVPELRFPDFAKSGNWQIKKLIDVADKDVKWSFIGGPFGSNLKSSDYVENGIRIIQLQNIGDGQFFNKYKIYTSNNKADELLSNNIYPGDIILSKMGDPVGRACLIPPFHDRYVMCSDGIRLVVDEKKNSKYFIYSLINSAPFRSLIEKSSTGSTRKRIGLDNLKKLPMFVPTVRDEQQKIADCLASIDDLIKAHIKKLDTIKAHKKGLMQQLFPAEGEIVPKRRFSEFSNGGSWEKRNFSQLFEIGGGKDHKHLPNGDIPVYGSGGYMRSANSFLYDGESACIGRKGTINKPMFLKGRFWTVDTLFYTHSFKECSPKFVYLLFQNINWLKLNEAGGVPSLSKVIINKVEVRVPSIDEQNEIVKTIWSIDRLITEQTQKIKSLKAHKKGLMQKLFPEVNKEHNS